MAKRIPETVIEEIKQKSDIVDVVSQYVNLSKKSAQNLFGLCPFHDEKTPSFSVSPHKQIFYCFGCSKGGDAINFIMGVEHMSYPEAIRFLGERVGVEVPDWQDNDDKYRETKERRERLYQLNTEAARYFYHALRNPEGLPAQNYLKSRGLSPQTVTSFGLGFAPDRWQGLLDHVRNKGYTEQEIADSGLFKQNRQGGLYDLFRNRLIFPIIDVMGRIIAFGGRVLDDSMPKYLNSPENLLYTKGRHLYGLNLAKKTKSDRLVIVEGYMDAIALHQAGFDQAVASLGTALTAQQAALLRKYSEDIVLGYDMDTAGRLATLRNIDMLEEKGAKPYVLLLPDAKDPDDYLRKHSPQEFSALLQEAAQGLEYKFMYARTTSLRDGRLDKVRYQEQASDLLLAIKNPVIRELYIPRVARELDVPEDSVQLLLQMRMQDQKQGTTRKTFLPLQENFQASSETAPGDSSSNPKSQNQLWLSPEEASFLVRLARRAETFAALDRPVEAKWFRRSRVRPFVEAVLAKAREGELSETLLLGMVNDHDEELTEGLTSQLGGLLIKDLPPETEEQTRDIMLRQILGIKLNYYSALSDAITKRLDSGVEENREEWREKFQRVRDAKTKLQQELKQVESEYIFGKDTDE